MSGDGLKHSVFLLAFYLYICNRNYDFNSFYKMKITNTIITTIALFCFTSFNIHTLAQTNSYMEQMQVQPDDYLKDFNEVDSIVRDKYTHIKSKEINIDSLYNVYQLRISEALTPITYGLILREYFAELQNCHTTVFFKNYSLDFNVERVEDRVFFKRIGKGIDTLNMLGVQVKDELLAIDGTPISDWINQNQRFISASTDRSRDHYTAWSVKYNSQPALRTYTIKTSSGTKDITLNFCKENDIYTGTPNQTVVQSIITDSIGYIAINTMGDASVVELFTQAYSLVEKLPYLIIDVRNNGGGMSNYSEKIAEYLITKSQKASVSTRKLKPKANSYKGNLFVLTDVGCGSAAESFVIDLKESGNANIVGMPTAGDTGNSPRVQTTSYGTSFNIPTRKVPQISPQGFPMEGVGIEPHYRIETTVNDYLNNVDTQLDYLLTLISEL